MTTGGAVDVTSLRQLPEVPHRAPYAQHWAPKAEGHRNWSVPQGRLQHAGTVEIVTTTSGVGSSPLSSEEEAAEPVVVERDPEEAVEGAGVMVVVTVCDATQ